MAGCERNDHDTASPGNNVGGTHDGFRSIIAPFDDDVGLELAHEFEWRVLIKDDHHIDQLQRGQDIGPITLLPNRTIRPFVQPSHRGIRIESDDELLAFGARAAQYVDVPGMQQIKNPVGKYHRARLVPTPFARRMPRENLAPRIECAQIAGRVQNVPVADGLK